MKITLLGTGAPIHPTRNTMGILLEATHCEPLLLDTCGGFEVTRALAQQGYYRSGKSIHNVIVSHQHGDHIGGVPALMIAFEALRFYGPSEALEAARAIATLSYPHFQELRAHQTNFIATDTTQTYDIGGFTLRFYAVPHRVPTYAVRVWHEDKVFAYSADSIACDTLAACAKDADLFLCDALCSSHDGYNQSTKELMHPLASEAAHIAKAAGAKQLALTHIGRIASTEAMLKEAQEIFGQAVSIPDDGDVILL